MLLICDFMCSFVACKFVKEFKGKGKKGARWLWEVHIDYASCKVMWGFDDYRQVLASVARAWEKKAKESMMDEIGPRTCKSMRDEIDPSTYKKEHEDGARNMREHEI